MGWGGNGGGNGGGGGVKESYTILKELLHF